MKKIINILGISFLLLLIHTSDMYGPSFKDEQLRYKRVRGAKAKVEKKMDKLFKTKGLDLASSQIFIRIFKSENILELWGKDSKSSQYKLVKSYDACAMSGLLGPKRKEGDLQVPEGFYHINLFNPMSSFHLSMQINYPNTSDRRLSRRKSGLGGQIFLHGACASIGCVAITDSKIKEVYWVSTLAHSNGQRRIPVHIFPSRMSSFKAAILKHMYRNQPERLHFWENLKQGYDYFQETRRVPTVDVDTKGKYLFR